MSLVVRKDLASPYLTLQLGTSSAKCYQSDKEISPKYMATFQIGPKFIEKLSKYYSSHYGKIYVHETPFSNNLQAYLDKLNASFKVHSLRYENLFQHTWSGRRPFFLRIGAHNVTIFRREFSKDKHLFMHKIDAQPLAELEQEDAKLNRVPAYLRQITDPLHGTVDVEQYTIYYRWANKIFIRAVELISETYGSKTFQEQGLILCGGGASVVYLPILFHAKNYGLTFFKTLSYLHELHNIGDSDFFAVPGSIPYKTPETYRFFLYEDSVWTSRIDLEKPLVFSFLIEQIMNTAFKDDNGSGSKVFSAIFYILGLRSGGEDSSIPEQEINEIADEFQPTHKRRVPFPVFQLPDIRHRVESYRLNIDINLDYVDDILPFEKIKHIADNLVTNSKIPLLTIPVKIAYDSEKKELTVNTTNPQTTPTVGIATVTIVKETSLT